MFVKQIKRGWIFVLGCLNLFNLLLKLMKMIVILIPMFQVDIDIATRINIYDDGPDRRYVC